MSYKTTHAYKASFNKLYKHLTSEDFLRKKYEGVGSRNIVFKACGQDDDVFRIEWTREVPSHPPGFAKKFLSEWNKTEEIMEWSREENGTAHADYECRVSGVPGVLRGEFDLRPKGRGCVEEIEMEASIKITIIGKKIAELVEQDAATSLAREYDFTRQYLGEV